MGIRIDTLGTLRIAVDGTEEKALHGQKLRCSLLVFLATEGTTTRDAILLHFWPDRPEDRARRALSQALYELRRTLGEGWLEAHGDQLTVTSDVVVDAAVFERALDAGDHAAALRLYRGPFLDGHHLHGTRPFEGWVEQHRAHLSRRHRQARREHLQQLAAAGATDALHRAARDWVDLDPLEDEAQHRLIEAMVERGERTAAIRQYERYRDLVRRELDVEPLEETTALIERVRGDAAVAPLPAASAHEADAPAHVAKSTDPDRPARGRPPATEPSRPPGPRRRRRNRRRLVVAGAAAAGIVLLIVLYPVMIDGSSGADPPLTRAVTAGAVAVLPFEVPGAPDTSRLGQHLATLVSHNLEGMVAVVPAARTARVGAAGAGSPSQIRELFDSSYIASGVGTFRGDDLQLRLRVQDPDGQRLPEVEIRGSAADLPGLADSVALALLRTVDPQLATSYTPLEALDTENLQALRHFLAGEVAFAANQWGLAEEEYARALEADSTFSFALWRLWTVTNWRWGDNPVDLEQLSRQYGDELGPVDGALVAARALPPGRARIEALERVARRFDHASYPWSLLGDEVYHRGPLVGESLERAARRMQEAALRDPLHAPTYEHQVLVLMRLWRQEEAAEALRRLKQTAAPPALDSRHMHVPRLLEQAYLERYAPAEAEELRRALFGSLSPSQLREVASYVRLSLSLDVPQAQLAVGRQLAASPGASIRANGHLAQALALTVLGRPREALSHLDTAAALSERHELAELDAAAWRVMMPLLGVDGVPEAETVAGRERLRRMADAPSPLGSRARWILAADAYHRGDLAEGARRQQALERATTADSTLQRLAGLVAAHRAMAEGQPDRALQLSEPLLRHQYMPDPGPPFFRSALHVLRARAHEQLGDGRGALVERMWADNQDGAHPRTLSGPLQPVEVDWAVSPYSDLERARLAEHAGDTALVCRLRSRVAQLWSDPEPRIAGLRPDPADVERRCR